jgi:VanZ family protein
VTAPIEPAGGDLAAGGDVAGRAGDLRRLGRAAVVFGVLSAVYAAGIFWASDQANPFPFVPSGLLSHDKLLHAGAYAGLGLLVRLALSGTRLRGPAALVVALAVASLYGVTDELHQYFVPNRQCDPLDWLADTAGALAGVAVAAAFLRRRVDAG